MCRSSAGSYIYRIKKKPYGQFGSADTEAKGFSNIETIDNNGIDTYTYNRYPGTMQSRVGRLPYDVARVGASRSSVLMMASRILAC